MSPPVDPFSKATSYQFRQSTYDQAKTLAMTSSPHYRRVLDPTATPSIIRTPDHDCHQINPENTRIKVVQRVWNTYFRMQVAAVYTCSTWRGTTRYNGAVAHCKCHAAHSSLAPTLYDDKLQLVAATILENGFQALTPTSNKYFSHRFELDTPAKKQLIDADTPERKLQELFQQLSLRQKKGSFVDTEAEEKRNATFQNPSESNRLDCHLEYHLRPFEDLLAEDCRKQAKTPVLCTQELVQKHIQLLDQAVQNIKIRQDDYEQFLKVHKELYTLSLELSPLPSDRITNEQCKAFVEKVREFLTLKGKLLSPLPGAPHLDEFIRFFLEKTPYYTLRKISKDFDDLPIDVFLPNFHSLLPSIQLSPIVQDVEGKKVDIQNRHEEAQIQLDELKSIQTTIPSFDMLFFGKTDEHGVRQAPTKEEIADTLIAGTHTIATKNIQKKLSYSDETNDT